MELSRCGFHLLRTAGAKIDIYLRNKNSEQETLFIIFVEEVIRQLRQFEWFEACYGIDGGTMKGNGLESAGNC